MKSEFIALIWFDLIRFDGKEYYLTEWRWSFKLYVSAEKTSTVSFIPHYYKNERNIEKINVLFFCFLSHTHKSYACWSEI